MAYDEVVQIYDLYLCSNKISLGDFGAVAISELLAIKGADGAELNKKG